MIIGFGNNVVSSLAADITATQTTIQVMPGAGALFAGLLTYDYANDSNPLKVYAKITLTDAKETVFEVCHLTSVNNDMLTVVRGQEGTAAKGWSLNDVIANFATRGSENQFVQIEQLQSGHYTSAVAGGTANGLTLALPATFFLNGSTEWALKTPILIYPTLNNTGASTLQLTMGGRVMGTYPLVKGSNTALRAGDIVAKNPFLAVFNADQGRFIVLNPTTDVGSVRSVNAIGPDAGGNVTLPLYGLGMGPQHKDDAYSNIAQFYRVNGTSVSSPGNGVYGVVSLPCDGGPSGSYLAIQANGIAYIGWSNTPANGVLWTQVFTAKNPPTAAGINAADVRNNFAARMGVSRVLTGNNAPTSAGVWSVENSSWAGTTWGSLICTTNSSDLSTTPGNQKFLHYLQIAHEAGGKAGLRTAINVNGTFSGWDSVMMSRGGTFTGAIGSSYSDTYRIVSGQYGTFWRNDGKALYLMLTNAGDQWGTFNNLRPFAVSTSDGSINVGTSFSVNYTGYINKLGVNPYTSNGQSFNQTNGLHIQGAGDQYADIYYLETVGKYGSLSFHIHGGGLDAYPAFNNNGSLSLNGSWPAISNSSGTTWHPDGNVEGPQWGGYLSNWLNQNISNAQNNAQNWAYQNLVQNVRLTGRINQPDTGGQVRVPDGCVFTGMSGANYAPSIWASYSYVQVLINGSWRNIGTS
ncbi:Uncharacterised protein [Serratia marcescens]|nr:Uncharacterised protein [Serratia marcescens]